VDVLAVQFDRRAIGRFGEPKVQVLGFAGLEEEDVVAIVEVCEFVEVGEVGFGVEFGIFAAVWEESMKVC
jgi:hypothetical protein